MKIEIRQFKVTVHFEKVSPISYTVKSPHPDEAMAEVRHLLGLPIGVMLTAKRARSIFIETEDR